jgi:hypothetical protein
MVERYATTGDGYEQFMQVNGAVDLVDGFALVAQARGDSGQRGTSSKQGSETYDVHCWQ